MTINPQSMLHMASPVDLAGINLGQMGHLMVRLARDEAEIEAAQNLRQKVFLEEFAQDNRSAEQPDRDAFDAICDHLLVIDQSLDGPMTRKIVGTYRFLPQERAERHRADLGGFYTESEFELAAMIARHPNRNFMELGRSCVLKEYRSKRTVELLWQGIWAYSLRHNIDVWTGCASFAGVVPAAHALGLSYLHHYHSADQEWQASALQGQFHTMDLMPREAISPKAAITALPPLIKGYLRLGAMVGHGCVVDRAFGSTDVLIILPVERVSSRYIRHYGENAERFAA